MPSQSDLKSQTLSFSPPYPEVIVRVTIQHPTWVVIYLINCTGWFKGKCFSACSIARFRTSVQSGTCKSLSTDQSGMLTPFLGHGSIYVWSIKIAAARKTAVFGSPSDLL